MVQRDRMICISGSYLESDNEAGNESNERGDDGRKHGIKRQHESAHGNVHVVEALVNSDYLHWMNLRFLLRMFRRR